VSIGLSGIITPLEKMAAYDGPWRIMRRETTLLQTRLNELRERERRLDDVLLVALVGGSGVGKSTLLNALAGDQIAETSEMRPCTSAPTVYHPPGMRFNLSDLPGVRHVGRSALEQIALIDTPDSDTIVKVHRAIVEQVLKECDLILLCADGEKYLDEATWSLLYPLRGMRAMVCVETRAMRADTAVRDHWLMYLRDKGFRIEQYFRVNALRTFNRKLGLSNGAGEEFDFAALEKYLHTFDREHVTRIKTSNAWGLLAKTVNRLHERLEKGAAPLDELQAALNRQDQALIQETLRHFTAGPLAEPHLWVQALGREVSLRAKGGIGGLYKIIEVLRSLPYRLPALLSFGDQAQHQEIHAGALFEGQEYGSEKRVLPETLTNAYSMLRSDMRRRLIQAGFDMPDLFQEDDFAEELNSRLRAVFGGAVREGLAARARLLCAWPFAMLLDCLPLAMLVHTTFLILRAYWEGTLLPASSFLHVGVVFALLVLAELFLFSSGVRLFAWAARKKGLDLLKTAMARPGLAFKQEKHLLEEAHALVRTIAQIQNELTIK